MEVPRLGVEWSYSTAVLDPSCICDLHHAHGNTGSLVHCARPGIEPASSWILVRFISPEPQQELLVFVT